MLDGYLAANILMSLLVLGLGALVIIKSQSAQLNKIFFSFCILTSVWLITNDLSNNKALSPNAILRSNHLVLCFSTLALFSLAAFTAYFVKNQTLIKLARPMLALNISVALLTLSSLVIKGTHLQSNAIAIEFGPLADVYFLTLGLDSLIIVWSLIGGLRGTKGDEHQRVFTVAMSFILMLVIVVALNAVVPLVTGSFNLTNVGPLSIIILASGTAYAMIRQKLFDIRSFVVRAFAYLLSLSITTLFYLAPVVAFTTYILHAPLDVITIAVLAISSLFIAVLYQPLRTYFNRTTSKLFFRDYYEPQTVLDNLSNLLARSVNLKEIEDESMRILSSALRPVFIKYLLQASNDEAFMPLIHGLQKPNRDLIALDELDEVKDIELKKLMNQYDVALAARLKTTKQELGFLLLSYKQSGGVYSKDDKKLLGIVADELAVGLQNALHFDEIQRFNITLQQKVEAATKELRDANIRLKQLDATKDEFISMASHQLRTPLTTIKGYLSMILEGDAGPINKNEEDMIHRAFNSAERMVYLIGDMLNVSRLQSGKFVIENKETDLVQLVGGEIEQLQETAKNHKLKLAFNKPENFPKLMLDENKVRQVVMNFLDNAIYYTPEGGSIDVALSATPETVSYTVTDTGLGVPVSQQPNLFAKFYRADNARKMRPDGTGLGLYMARKVVVAQGGAIIFKSTEGKGSTFGFSFPRKAMEVKVAPVKEAPANEAPKEVATKPKEEAAVKA